jgi:hypothetical protein
MCLKSYRLACGVVCHAFGEILFVPGNFTYSFYHILLIYYAMNENGWGFVGFWWLKLFAWSCVVDFLCEYMVLVLCFYLGNLICGLCAVEFFYVSYVMICQSFLLACWVVSASSLEEDKL